MSKFIIEFLKSLFRKKSPVAEVPVFDPSQVVPPVINQDVEFNIDTGKIILPENLSAEDVAEINAAIKQLKESLANPDVHASFEEFLKSQSTGTGLQIPFITANGLPDGQDQVWTEMEEHKEDSEHYTAEDYLDHLLAFHNQGYEFSGLEQIYNRYVDKIELREDEIKKLRDWYVLVSQELVYHV